MLQGSPFYSEVDTGSNPMLQVIIHMAMALQHYSKNACVH